MKILYAPKHKTRRGRPRTTIRNSNDTPPTPSQEICNKTPLEQLVLYGLISCTDAEMGHTFQRLREQAARLINAPRLVRQAANPACVGEKRGSTVDTPETTYEKRLLTKWSLFNKRLQEWGEDYFLLLEWSLTPTNALEKSRLIQVAKVLVPLLQDLVFLEGKVRQKCAPPVFQKT
jgi:hypothetical protein